jgi:bla regulator protein blaR1
VKVMAQCISRKLDFSRKLSLTMAAVAAIAAPVFFGLVHITPVQAQSTADNPATNLSDTWQGTLHAGQDLRTVVKISKADGGYKAVFYSLDQGGAPLPVTKITLEGTTVKMSLTAIGGTYEGKLSADGKTITGNWTQGPNPLPLNLTRATPETEWAIPAPPPKLPPMDANASPSFEVATIKPTKPDEQRKAFLVKGRHFRTINVSLNELISFAYGVHSKQVTGAPDWAGTDKFDIDAQPDGEGAPSNKQWKGMLQKLIVERFKLTFHRDKKELSVYVLSVAKTGQKLTKSEGDPNGLPALFFQGLGDLHVTNANLADFAGLMQEAVLDRPVLDQTGLNGRFDFTLKWTPDDSQFGGMGAKIPPPTDSATAPPALYTAIQEQIGLKLDATRAPAEVLVIDHVEKPSAN